MNKPKIDIGMEQKFINFCANGCGVENRTAPDYSCLQCCASEEQCARNQRESYDIFYYLLRDNSVM